MKNYPMQILGAIMLGIAFLVFVLKIRSAQSTPETPQKARAVLVENEYTVEQKALLSDMKQMREEIAKAKKEINDTLVSLRASTVQHGMDPNCQTSWLQVGYYGADRIYNVITSGTTNPILWGFRSDGLVTWKNQ